MRIERTLIFEGKDISKLLAVRKAIGKTSSDFRLEKGLTETESDLCEDFYRELSSLDDGEENE